MIEIYSLKHPKEQQCFILQKSVDPSHLLLFNSIWSYLKIIELHRPRSQFEIPRCRQDPWNSHVRFSCQSWGERNISGGGTKALPGGIHSYCNVSMLSTGHISSGINFCRICSARSATSVGYYSWRAGPAHLECNTVQLWDKENRTRL